MRVDSLHADGNLDTLADQWVKVTQALAVLILSCPLLVQTVVMGLTPADLIPELWPVLAVGEITIFFILFCVLHRILPAAVGQ